jgi:hypothetical protein
VSYEKVNRSEQSNDPRIGDSKFICFRFRKLEFFFPVEVFALHSEYFSNLISYLATENDAQKHKVFSEQPMPQVMINLPDDTKATTLVYMLNCMANEEDDFRANELNLFMAIELVELAHQLKMRPVVMRLLRNVII